MTFFLFGGVILLKIIKKLRWECCLNAIIVGRNLLHLQKGGVDVTIRYEIANACPIDRNYHKTQAGNSHTYHILCA